MISFVKLCNPSVYNCIYLDFDHFVCLFVLLLVFSAHKRSLVGRDGDDSAGGLVAGQGAGLGGVDAGAGVAEQSS